ncbi:MAG: LytTR family DNA-binding domain-containing protein [Casimicrobiaceae bacterium]
MPTALIADDEAMLRGLLRNRLAQAWPELTIIAEAENGEEAVELATRTHPDIVFLDIRMPVQTGLDAARALGGLCHVVFVTAYDEYAVAAFEEGAADYLLKPPSPERIAMVVARLQRRLAAPPLDWSTLLLRLARAEPGTGPLRWVRASLGNAMRLIDVTEVLYFQAEDKYTKVVTAEVEALIRKPIRELYRELDPESFWQVHRSTIVNLRAVARVERDWRDQPVILLKDRNEKLTVSRTFAHRFKAM